jgi:hypothetical protein
VGSIWEAMGSRQGQLRDNVSNCCISINSVISIGLKTTSNLRQSRESLVAYFDIVGVTGSIPVAPTIVKR